MSARQEAVHRNVGAPEPAAAAAAAAAAPEAGEEFTEEEMAARSGAPALRGMRAGRENRSILIVGPAGAGSGSGAEISCAGQDPDRGEPADREMSGANLALSRSRTDGYAVLYFTKEGDRPAFDFRAECASHGLEVEQRAGGRPRVVVRSKLGRAGGAPGAEDGDAEAPGKLESLGCPWVAELEEDKLPTETVGEYLARMANIMDPGMCTQKDAEEMDEGLRQLAKGEYATLDDVLSELGYTCTRPSP